VEPLGFSLDDRELLAARGAARVALVGGARGRATRAGARLVLQRPRRAGALDLWSAPFEEPAVLLFGRRSLGLPRALRERYREAPGARPPHDPALRSLNLSTCVAVALYELLRQRRG
jgi:tRNA (cytidine/uridine-2'-O-)-methyltransferase